MMGPIPLQQVVLARCIPSPKRKRQNIDKKRLVCGTLQNIDNKIEIHIYIYVYIYMRLYNYMYMNTNDIKWLQVLDWHCGIDDCRTIDILYRGNRLLLVILQTFDPFDRSCISLNCSNWPPSWHGKQLRCILVGGWATPLKNMSSSMGRMTSHILWKIKNLPNHQPVYW